MSLASTIAMSGMTSITSPLTQSVNLLWRAGRGRIYAAIDIKLGARLPSERSSCNRRTHIGLGHHGRQR
jgi:hypothetical protein